MGIVKVSCPSLSPLVILYILLRFLSLSLLLSLSHILITFLQNFTELSIPSLFERFNGKPAIIFKSGSIVRGEVSIDIFTYFHTTPTPTHVLVLVWGVLTLLML